MSKTYNCKLGGDCAQGQCQVFQPWQRCEHLNVTIAPLPQKETKEVSLPFHWSFMLATLLTYGAFCWFLFVTFYHTDPNGYSWVLYHLDNLFLTYMLILTALPFYVHGILRMRK